MKMEEQNVDIKELENHFKTIDDFFSDIIRPRRYKSQTTLDIFDLRCLNTYRVYKPQKKLLVFYKVSAPYWKFYDITDEQIKKLEKYYH
ncbi:MAG: hypothetical protein IPJ01_11205 [Micavibrio sp.]|nr:hypothetical protein [Micavibrio sp.]